MDADVKLDKQTLTLEGDVVKCTGNIKSSGVDLEIDNPERRKVGGVAKPGLNRRALVHDFGDKLTLNWGGDYSGGVYVVNDINVRLKSGKIPWPDLNPNAQGGLVVTNVDSVALMDELQLMRAKIALMQGELDKLKKKVP